MSTLSSTERIVLLALQARGSALSDTELAIVTALPMDRLRKALLGLVGVKRVNPCLAGHTDQFYSYTHPASDSVMPHWRSWLAAFCGAQSQYVPGDTLGTTFACCGVVLLTAMVGGTLNKGVISRVTTLPVAYVDMVLDMADQHHIWHLDSIFHLRRQVGANVNDFPGVQKALQWVTEDLWELSWTPVVQRLLVETRAGHQFGGRVDDWTDSGD